MKLQVVAIYFFADEVLKANHFHDDPQAHMSTAEVMTVAITAARFFYGNQRRAAEFLREHRYISHFLSESHFIEDFTASPKSLGNSFSPLYQSTSRKIIPLTTMWLIAFLSLFATIFAFLEAKFFQTSSIEGILRIKSVFSMASELMW